MLQRLVESRVSNRSNYDVLPRLYAYQLSELLYSVYADKIKPTRVANFHTVDYYTKEKLLNVACNLIFDGGKQITKIETTRFKFRFLFFLSPSFIYTLFLLPRFFPRTPFYSRGFQYD